jgi:hypothetical protein
MDSPPWGDGTAALYDVAGCVRAAVKGHRLVPHPLDLCVVYSLLDFSLHTSCNPASPANIELLIGDGFDDGYLSCRVCLASRQLGKKKERRQSSAVLTLHVSMCSILPAAVGIVLCALT